LVLEYVENGEHHWRVHLSNGTSFQLTGYDWAVSGAPGVTETFADVNGDLKADLILKYRYGGDWHWRPRLSDGKGSFYETTGYDWAVLTSGSFLVGFSDISGDDRLDLILQF
jgi:hypothetical protein